MRDPERLLDQSDDPFERAMLRSAKADAGSARSLAKAMAAFGTALGLVSQGTPAAALSGVGLKSVWMAYVVKGLAGGALAAATSVGTLAGVRALSDNTAPERPEHGPSAVGQAPAIATAPKASPSQPEPAAGPPKPPPSPPKAEPGRSALSEPTHSEAKSAESLAREVALLRTARLALARGDARAALAAVERWDQQCAPGSLGPEAVLLTVESLVKMGDRVQAKQVAEAFLKHQRRGPHADRMRALVGANKP
jgi:hypothetical protein